MVSYIFGLLLAGLAVLISVLYGPLQHSLLVAGVFRTLTSTPLAPVDIVRIPDTIHCEDLHYYEPAHLLFTACEDNAATRGHWFPPLGIFTTPEKITGGSLHVIDPETFQSKCLNIPDFDTPLVTHGIDIIADPTDDKSIYIYAVNHQPNHAYLERYNARTIEEADKATDKAASRIEIFHHVLGTNTATHIRTVSHPRIRTPNDILAVTRDQFFVTNDHYRRDGLLREIEDVVSAARWSDVIRVDADLSNSSADAKVSVAYQRLHNPNGLGHGTGKEILMTSAASGQLYLVDAVAEGRPGEMMRITDTVRMDSSVDNPSFFSDAYANSTHDASGIVLAGLSKAVHVMKLKKDIKTPLGVVVWLVKKDEEGEWVKKILFEDDGSRISSASAAVVLPIDPAREGGRKKAWLWITGFVSESAIAVKVDL